MRIVYLSLLSSFLGLLVVYYSVPSGYPPKTVDRAVMECDGRAEVHGSIVRQFVSKKGSLIAVLEGEQGTILTVVKSRRTPGRNRVKGRLSEYNGQCWLFEEG